MDSMDLTTATPISTVNSLLSLRNGMIIEIFLSYLFYLEKDQPYNVKSDPLYGLQVKLLLDERNNEIYGMQGHLKMKGKWKESECS